ncbi:hypothetical protein ACQP1W_32140 [Spirillospora sp. CA-255316]
MALPLGGDNPDVPHRGNACTTLDELSIAADATASTMFWKVLAGGGLAPQKRVLGADRRRRGQGRLARADGSVKVCRSSTRPAPWRSR